MGKAMVILLFVGLDTSFYFSNMLLREFKLLAQHHRLLAIQRQATPVLLLPLSPRPIYLAHSR